MPEYRTHHGVADEKRIIESPPNCQGSFRSRSGMHRRPVAAGVIAVVWHEITSTTAIAHHARYLHTLSGKQSMRQIS